MSLSQTITQMMQEGQEKKPLGLPPAPQKESWVKDLISQRYQPQTKRIVRQPIGFQFNRDPFDPSSYYRQLGSLRDISVAATNVSRTEANNRAQKEYESSLGALNGALGGVNPNFTYSGKSKKYGLKGVSSHVARQADYIGSMFGIKNIGGYREHGSVPGSDHPKGRALDFMTYKNKKQGTALANYVVSNAKRLAVKYVIWNRKIWSPGRGWRNYNGPSPHTDHVHVSYLK